jgi:hypothetical protein
MCKRLVSYLVAEREPQVGRGVVARVEALEVDARREQRVGVDHEEPHLVVLGAAAHQRAKVGEPRRRRRKRGDGGRLGRLVGPGV